MAVSKGRALSATINSATSLIKSSIDGTVTTSTLEQSAQQYANAAALPSVGNTFGEMALVQSTNRMYVWNGSGWYNVALINTNPVFTTSPASEYTFGADSPRSTITITVAASDPESIGVSFSFETGGSMDSMASVTQDSSVFTLVPKGNDSLTDGVTLTGSLTIKATDGVNIVPAVSSFTLTFVTVIANSASTQTLMKATGTGNNNTFLDGSTNNYTITHVGDTEQHAFSPFRLGGYCLEFDAYGDEIEFPDIAGYDIGTSQFSVEAWVYPTAGVNNYSCGIIAQFASASRGWGMTFNNTQIKFYGSTNGGSSTNTVHTATYTVPHFQWTHIVTTRDDTNIRIFVNGQLILAAANTGHYHNSTQPLRIGEANSGTAENFKGFMKDVRLVVGSIPTEYQTNSTTVNTGVFTPPTETLTAISGTQLLTGNTPYIKDVSSNNATPSFNGSPAVAGFSPYDKGNAYTTATGGGSALFDGNGDYLTIANSQNFYNLGTADWTIECWVYFTNRSVFNGVFQLGQDVGALSAMLYTDGKLKLLENDQAVVFESNTTFVANTWYHIAFTNNDSTNTQKLYVNGVQESNTGSKSTAYSYVNKQVFIGGRWFSNAFQRPMSGYISNFRIVGGSEVYTGNFTVPSAPLTAVTNTKLLLNMTNAKVFDASQSRKLMSFASDADSPVASSGQQHFGENTIFFDGTGDYIVMDNPIEGLEDHTHEAWVYPTAGSTNHKGFFASAPDGSGSGINVSKDVAGGPNNSGGMVINFNPVVPDNEWSHVALQRQSGVHSLYRNGVLQGTSTGTVNFDTANLRMASRYNNTITYAFGGYIHDFRVSKGLARFPYIAKPVTLTQTNSGMEKPDGTTPTATASNTKLLAFTTSTITSDASASPHTLTAAGSAAASTNAPAAEMHSAYFANGDADIITIPASADHQIYGGDYTVEAWLYPTNFNTNYNYFMSKGGTGTREWAFGLNASNIRVYWSTNGSGSGDTNVLANVTNRINEWIHVAVTKSGNDISVFKNGNLVGTGTFSSIYGGNGITTISRLWTYTGIAHSYDGYISNLRIIKGEAIYSKNFTPVTTALSG